MTELWIVQPYVPAYRVAFFERLMTALEADGINVHVVAGKPAGAQATRGDASAPSWLVTLKPRELRLGKRTVTLTSSRHQWADADAVIVPHMGSSLDAMSALLTKRPGKVGVWGHIASFTSPANPVDAWIERWQLRRADQVFAYTPKGAAFAREVGVDPARVTTVMNSLDTLELSADIARLTRTDIDGFRARHAIPDGPLVAFLGGLDSSKRISFLAESLDELNRRKSPAHLVVAGSGVEAHLLASAVDRGQVTMLGYTSGTDKAAVLSMTCGIVNPGRVGLLAVDGLVARRPILTTDWPWHAPELEYLREGLSVLTSEDDPKHFASLIEYATAGGTTEDMSEWPTPPSLEDMALNYRSGVINMLSRD